MKDAVMGRLVTRDRKLSDERPLLARECRDMALRSNLLQIRCDQHALTTTRDPDVVEMSGQTRVGC